MADTGEPWVSQASHLALLRMVAMEDGMSGVAGLLSDRQAEGGVFTPWVVGRFVIENAALLWWLMEPDLDVQNRIARALTDRVRSHQEAGKVERDMGIDDPLSANRLERIRAQARSLGMEFHDPPRQGWSVGGQHRPERTDLVKMLFDAADLEGGVVAYRYLTGVSHGERFALMQHMGTPHETDLGRLVQPQVTIEQVALLVAAVLLAVVTAVDRAVPYFGWDPEMWSQWSHHAVNLIAGHLSHRQDQSTSS